MTDRRADRRTDAPGRRASDRAGRPISGRRRTDEQSPDPTLGADSYRNGPRRDDARGDDSRGDASRGDASRGDDSLQDGSFDGSGESDDGSDGGGRTTGAPYGVERRRRRFRFRLISPTGAPVVAPDRLDRGGRLRAMLPSLFTLVNLLCGFSAILASIDGKYDHAAVLVAVAIVFDIADGAVARAVGAITPFGLQFDSLADLTSFGMAPALLLYNRSLFDMYWVGWLAAGLWIACAAFRLARFNVTIDPLADKRYFIGLASPGAAGVVIATVFAFDPPTTGAGRWWPVLVAVVPALLMVSSIRFLAFRMLVTPAPGKAWVSVLVLAALVVGLATAPALTALVVAYGYVLSAPLGWLTAPVRARLFGRGAVAPPRHRLPSVFFPAAAEVDDPAYPDDMI